MLVRPATPEDATAMERIYARAGKVAWSHFLPVDGIEARAGAFDDVDGFVAEEDGEVVGFASVRGCELDMLYALPEVWGRGVGRQLMAAALAAIHAAGHTQAMVWTAEQNARSRRAYEQHGWRPDGSEQEQTYAGVTFTQVRYTIEL